MKKILLILLSIFILGFGDWWESLPSVYDADSIDTDHLVVNTTAKFLSTVTIDGGNLIVADGQNIVVTDDTEADTVKLYHEGSAGILAADDLLIFNAAGGSDEFRVGNGYVDVNCNLRGQNDAGFLTWDGKWASMDSDADDSLCGIIFGLTDTLKWDSIPEAFTLTAPLTVGGDLSVSDGKITQETYVIRKFVSLEGATDATPTNFFTITTTDETGSADGGMYSVMVHLTAGEATAAEGAVNTASVSLIAHWSRIMASNGDGTNTAVVEISETANVAKGTGAISEVTLTVVSTTEFIQTVQLNVNTSGGTFDGFALVELVYSDFITPPVIE